MLPTVCHSWSIAITSKQPKNVCWLLWKSSCSLHAVLTLRSINSICHANWGHQPVWELYLCLLYPAIWFCSKFETTKLLAQLTYLLTYPKIAIWRQLDFLEVLEDILRLIRKTSSVPTYLHGVLSIKLLFLVPSNLLTTWGLLRSHVGWCPVHLYVCHQGHMSQGVKTTSSV